MRMRSWSARSSASHCGGRRTDDGGRPPEDGGRTPEDGGRRVEDGGRAAEDGRLSGMSRGPLGTRGGLHAAGNQHGKGIARAARADAHLDFGEARVLQQSLELGVFETEPLVAETI